MTLPNGRDARALAGRLGRIVLRAVAATAAVVAVVLAAARTMRAVSERVPRDVLMPAGGSLLPGGDVRLFLQQAGPPSGAAVVLIHGTGAWSEIWRPVMTALSAAGFRAIAVDMPPFGFSDRSPLADYTPNMQARRLWIALDSLGVSRPILVGHSFGARATVAAALMRPAHVQRLVLIDAALGLDTALATGPPSMPLRVLLATPFLLSPIVAATVTNPMMTRTLTGQLVAHPERLTEAQITMLQRPLRQPGSTAAATAWLPGFISDNPDVASGRRVLAGFARPTHLIWGALDELTPVSSGNDLARLLPCATWDLLRDSGHIPGLEAPDALSSVLLARLRAPAVCTAAR